MDNFQNAFKNNFYGTAEYAQFCARVTNIPLQERKIFEQTIHLIRNKNITISNYSDELIQKFQQQKITYVSVTPEINQMAGYPSVIEYSIIYWTTYEEAVKKYRTSFFHGLREGKKFPHSVNFLRQPDAAVLDQIYTIYVNQMRRKNSFIFPRSYFTEFFQGPSSLLLTLEFEGKIIAYFCCFQYMDNIYSSIGGGNPDFFSFKSSNKLYDELIRYACENNLNIHAGMGEYNSGYQNFKLNAGAVAYKTVHFPDEERLLKLALPLLKYHLTGQLLFHASKLFPRSIIYMALPAT